MAPETWVDRSPPDRAGRSGLLHQEGQDLQRGGIDPVQIVDNEQHRLPGSERQHQRQDGF